MKLRLLGTALALATTLLLARAMVAAECCDSSEACCQNGQACRHGCGRCGHCGCQLVCDVKEEKKTVWVVKCESMCTILPGCGPKERVCVGDGCGACCASGGDGKGDGCACLVEPKCGHQRCIKKLEKKEITVKKPVYKCVACGCEGKADSEPAKTPIETPAPAPAPQKAPAPPKAPAPQPLPKQARSVSPLPDLR